MNPISIQKADKFFPAPSAAPTSLCAQRLPGPNTVGAGEAVKRILRDNHVKNHIFFKSSGNHNHISHHTLAVYGLGASSPIIETLYDTDLNVQRGMPQTAEKITLDNFGKHLSDENYYPRYVEFFAEEIDKHGVPATLERFMYSDEFNVNVDGTGHAMLARNFIPALHAMIHFGYAVEFGIQGLVAEGLAMAAVDINVPNTQFLAPLWTKVSAKSSVGAITDEVSSLGVSGTSGVNGTHKSTSETTVFDILPRVLKYDKFAATNSETPQKAIKVAYENHGDRMVEYALDWSIDLSKLGELERKIEELQWLNVTLYGVGGWREGEGLQADFFVMHLVTSSLFLGPNVHPLSQRSQEIFLRAYFANTLALYHMFGRPPLHISAFWKNTTAAEAFVPGSDVSAGYTAAQVDAKVLAATKGNPNPWLTHAQSAIVAKDDHYAKIIRALLHLATQFGDRPTGHLAKIAPNSGLEGLEQLDGSFFLRVAGLTAEAVYETQAWSFGGFYKNEL